MASQADPVRYPSAGAYMGENLIFVISQPRSGSTLLQRVLAGHPAIQTSAETWLMLHPAYGLKMQGIESEFGSRWRAHAVTEFLDNYTDGRQVYDEATRAWAAVIYGNALARSGRSLFLDKTPRYFFIIPELYRWFPEAKFVFLLRNPMAVLASELETYVKGDWPVLGLFAPDLLEAPRLIIEGMELLGSSAIRVCYEDFVSHPDRSAAELCERLEIPFHPPMLDYAATPVPKGGMNDRVGIHRHSRPSTESLDKWKTLADDPQSRAFARGYLDDLGPDTLSALGYSYDEIDRVLSDASSPQEEINLFPWRVAITPKEQWSARQRFQAERYFRIEEKQSTVRGTLSAVRRTVRRWSRQARRELRS